MARDTWYRLDNVGKFYSSQAGSSAQTVFRYAATMQDDVDPAALQHALEKTAGVFPNFNVCLRSGMFWHYLEQSAQVPVVQQENLPICYGLHVHAKSVLFRVSYHAARINLEVSHIVSDGRGSLSFFKALLHAYIEERYGVKGVPAEYDGSDHQKSENSFDKYFERDKAAATRAPKVYRLKGWRDEADPTFFEYHLPAKRVLALARSWDVGVTALVIAVIMCAIRAEMPRRDRSRAIRIDEDEPVETIARIVQDQLKTATQAEELKSRMNRMIALEKNPLLRLAPLFAKDFILGLANRLAARDVTTTMSNLGPIRIDERLALYIRDVNILTSTTGLNFLMCAFGDDLSIGISTVYSNPDVIKNICRFFSGQGIEGRININKTKEEVAEDRLEAKIEASVKRWGGQTPAREGASAKSEAPAHNETDAREDDGR